MAGEQVSQFWIEVSKAYQAVGINPERVIDIEIGDKKAYIDYISDPDGDYINVAIREVDVKQPALIMPTGDKD